MGQRVPGRRADPLVGARERVADRLAQAGRRDHPGHPEPGGEDLRRGAEVGHDVRAAGHAVQRGQPADVVTELPVVVVLDHQRASPAGPADQGRAPGRGQPRAERKLVGRRGVRGGVARVQVGRVQALLVHRDRADDGARGLQRAPPFGISGLLERHRAPRQGRRKNQCAKPGGHARHQDDVRRIRGHAPGPAQVRGQGLLERPMRLVEGKAAGDRVRSRRPPRRSPMFNRDQAGIGVAGQQVPPRPGGHRGPRVRRRPREGNVRGHPGPGGQVGPGRHDRG